MDASTSSVDISVCVANYNGSDYVLDCIASIYAQKGPFSIEIIVHDDASSDNSIDKIQGSFPQVVLLRSDTNVGFCISNNRMAHIARGRFILLLNNDAVLRPGSLLALFERAITGHDLEIMSLRQYTLTDGSLIDCGYRTDFFLNPIPILVRDTHEVGVATGACLWIPRQVWNEVGGFPPWFGSIAEDIFFCIAARLLGYCVVVLAEPGFDHWIGRNLGGGKIVANRLSTTVRRRTLSERNKTFVMLLCYPKYALLMILPLHIMLLFAEVLFLLIIGTQCDSVWRIYAALPSALWRQRKQIIKLRAHLMHQRKCTLARFFAQTSWVPQKIRLFFRHGKPELH
jgi:GT2 family glycosyltransferase